MDNTVKNSQRISTAPFKFTNSKAVSEAETKVKELYPDLSVYSTNRILYVEVRRCVAFNHKIEELVESLGGKSAR